MVASVCNLLLKARYAIHSELRHLHRLSDNLRCRAKITRILRRPYCAGRGSSVTVAAQPGRHFNPQVALTRSVCGAITHIHETQIQGVPDPIGATCHGCTDILAFPPGFFADAFAELRRRGWLA